MNNSKFFLRNGQLNDYSLKCGYIQEFTLCKITIKLYHDGCYQVRVNSDVHGELRWMSFSNLTLSRYVYTSIAKRVKEMCEHSKDNFFEYVRDYPDV